MTRYFTVQITCSEIFLGPTTNNTPGVLTPVVRRPVRKAIRSPQCTAEVKYTYSYSCIFLYVLMAWCVINYSDNVTFIRHSLILL